MILIKKILKYLACVAISMVGFTLFVLVLGENMTLSQINIKGDIPLYLGVGWAAYQVIFNKIYEQNLNYYWMIAKLALQMSAIIFISFIIMKIV